MQQGGAPHTGVCNFRFGLWSAASGGTQTGVTQTHALVVTAGLFTRQLDFGDEAFNGEERYLAIEVRCPANVGSYTALSPRQLTPAPYALALPGLWTRQNNTSANVIGSYFGNVISNTLVGSAISGGGSPGSPNRAWADYAAIGGGAGNTAGGFGSAIGGGIFNIVSGDYATVGGGSNNTASGSRATVGGGSSNLAAGDYSFVAGRRARNSDANHNGVFLFADSNAFNFPSTAANQFRVRTTGGAQFVLGIDGSGNPTWTCSVSNSSSWSCSSDRNLKENLLPVDGRATLEALSRLPLHTWNAKGTDPAVKHPGPMAQDFYAAFGLGDSDISIATIDLDGVALAAIQGLYAQHQELQQENMALRARLETLEARLAALEQAGGRR